MHTTSSSLVSLFFAVLLMPIAATAEKNGYYRWVDDNGSYHFSQLPPEGKQYEFIESDTRMDFGDDAGDETQSGRADTTSNDSPATPTQMEVLPERNPRLCEQAKQNLQSLSVSGVRIRGTRPDGSTYLLSPDEIDVQRQRAKEAQDIHCR